MRACACVLPPIFSLFCSFPMSAPLIFQLTDPATDHVELCHLLKLVGLADSGGQGKLLVADGQVMVDGQLETRKRAKIRAGQRVSCLGQQIVVRAGQAPEEA